MSDDELATTIRADSIDILIDLSGHTAGNRLGVFARKPAPVQLSAWGNATGTGSPTQDYVFADPIAVPPGVRHFFVEQVHDLPVFMSMEPPPAHLRTAEPPCLVRGYVTFGVFNRINKISPQAIKTWCDILHGTPNSKLVIKNPALDDALLRQNLVAQFSAHQISADRIECVGSTSRGDHLAAYGHVDICLDPFPQNGGISTWEALHMGVPVVAKLGNTYASRISCSIQSSIGLSEWMRHDESGYIDFALELASRPEYLKSMRHELPARIEASVAGNPVAYTKAVEGAYRELWGRYCNSSPSTTC
jgi:predicted O-linked N-acetylglucosamine transferase (SPINDLY family)